MAVFILTSDQQVTLSVAYTDDHGNPADVDDVPVWAVSDDTILAFEAADDGMSAIIWAVGPAGQAQASVSATDGGNSVIGLLDMQVVSGLAVSAVLTPGSPTDHLVVNPLTP